MIEQTQTYKDTTPYRLDDSVLDELSSIQAIDGDIHTLDDDLVSELLVKYPNDPHHT